jgi:hypothetical protein
MSEEKQTPSAPIEEEELPPGVDLDADPMRDLLKRAIAKPTEASAPEKPMLAEVQRKLRVRSQGKFYGDGWSTTNEKVSYALVATVMLIVIAIAYFALGPTGISR